MVFIVFSVIGLLSTIAALLFKNKLAIVGSLGFLVISIIIPVAIYSSNIGAIADLYAFYNASSTNKEVMWKCQGVLGVVKPMIGSILAQ